MNELTVRTMRPEDLPAVCAIEKENFSVPWSEKSFLDSMEREDTVFLVAVHGEKTVGYIGCYCIAGTGEITNVAVKHSWRRKRVGSLLLDKLCEEASAFQCRELLLEVRESNAPAIALYTRQGFEKLGIRKNFYERPVEHAVVMRKKYNE